VPVHPTQLYEAAFLALLAWLLIRWRRRGMNDQWVLGMYLLLAGGFRFLLEFVRVNTRVFGPFTVAHSFAAMVAIAGAAIVMGSRRAAARSAAQL